MEQSISKIRIVPIEKESWHKKKGEEIFKRPTVIRALVNPEKMEYSIEATDEELNEWGRELGVDLNRRFNPEEPHPFYDGPQGKIKLNQASFFLDPSNTLQRVKIAILKASKFVANSEAEISKYPEATHVIFDEDEQLRNKASKIEVKRQAMLTSYEMSRQEKVDILMILTEKSVRNQSDNFIDVLIDEEISKDPKKFLAYATSDKESLKLRAMVLEGLSKGILTKEGNGVYYMGDKIANTTDEAIDYFKDKNNQNIKASIVTKITGIAPQQQVKAPAPANPTVENTEKK